MEPTKLARALQGWSAKRYWYKLFIPYQSLTKSDHRQLPDAGNQKSEVLRAGLFAFNAMNDASQPAALNSVPSLKTGRPKRLPTK